MNIVITDGKTIFGENSGFDMLSDLGDVTIYKDTKDEELVERIKDADIVLCNKTVIKRHHMELCRSLKYIGLFATGYNNIDIDAAREFGIVVCNAGNYSTNAVAQHTFALILNHFNKISQYDRFTKENGWKKSDVFSPIVYETHELKGKTIGIVGFGSIGEKVAKIAMAFDMNVLAYNRHPKVYEGVRFVDLETLVSQSDVVTVHCPLNGESEKMFNKELFKKFKRNSIFINTARGGIVDEDDLADMLRSKKISAGIDVLTKEPMDEKNELNSFSNITMTPHVAWAPVETRERLLGIVCENIANFMEGHPTNVVNG